MFFKKIKRWKFLAFHDALTKLLNRNWFYENKKFIKTKYVYFIDINNLHKINKDGHAYGDEHIKRIIKQIQDIPLFKEEKLIRYAGDEFLLFSNRLNLLSTNEFISVGFSVIEDDVNEAINVADKEMLRSKKERKKL